MKASTKHSRSTQTQSAEAKLIEVLERENAALQRQNAKLLRMVEMVMEERFFRPTITGGIRENLQAPGLPIDSLNDVTVFDETADGADVLRGEERLMTELREIEAEHQGWRKGKNLADVEDRAAAVA